MNSLSFDGSEVSAELHTAGLSARKALMASQVCIVDFISGFPL
jgi:hypothetical protein